MTTSDTHRSALEMLVIAQLSVLRKRESELQSRLQSTAGPERTSVANEVWHLRTSADRLGRMMDAM
jgi:hypothetical protein